MMLMINIIILHTIILLCSGSILYSELGMSFPKWFALESFPLAAMNAGQFWCFRIKKTLIWFPS